MIEKIKEFRAEGILGQTTYIMRFENHASIIVGPNGTGKSTFITLLYLLLSRQWARLAEYDFDVLNLVTCVGDITVTKLDVLAMGSVEHRSLRMSRYISEIYQKNLLETIYKDSLTRSERTAISSALSIPESQVKPIKRILADQIGLNQPLVAAEQSIASLGLGTILYLPTYRRIEKDIRSIFPDIENSIRSKIADSSTAGRSGSGFREITGFGMLDINRIMDDAVKNVKEFQRKTSERTSQEYIRDIVRGEISNYTLSNIRSSDDRYISSFRQRLDNDLFTEGDKDILMNKIAAIQRKTKGQPTSEQRYLGMFVERLLAGHQQVAEMEQPLRSFIRIVSEYLSPGKRVTLSEHGLSILDAVTETPLILEKLSSGEKQVIAVFAYLLLSGNRDFIFVIDEPELSLSVPWQKRFIPDLIDTGHCSYLIAVTHSPFVFDNSFRSCVTDVRRLQANQN